MKFAPSQSESEIQLADCWAKTDLYGRPALSVRTHGLNAGAVAEAVVQALPPAAMSLVPKGGVALVALHDIGKISPGFLMKCDLWREQWQSCLQLGPPDKYEGNHAKSGQHFLAGQTNKPPKWLMAVGGHHGMYPFSGARANIRNFTDHPALAALKRDFLDECKELFGTPPEEPVEKSARLHWFTGLMIFCDWIASNTDWFRLGEREPPTLEQCSQRAGAALGRIGWHRRATRSFESFEASFGFPPRPLQSTLLKAMDSPGLYIVEAPMGEGKTEAALATAQQRWTHGGERGLYFALPTQLTSNRIHGRIAGFLGEIIDDESALALVHGNAWLSDERISPLLPAAPESEATEQAAEANRWFADSRKALLAPFGTGTLDQALLSVLPARFSALRLFALAGKVVVIDEVHSYDPYTSTFVDRLVKWLLEAGATVIILSATLTAKRRAELVAAAGALEEKIPEAYPLITKVATGTATVESFEADSARRAAAEVIIGHASRDDADWMESAVAAAESGACVLVVRNTVAEAQQTWKELKTQSRDGLGVEFGLLHSRFPLFQREANEESWMARLGKDGGQRPCGAILVGTQVLEQSIDIDADLLFTDLAPTDLILQRIGRLHRHDRPRPEVAKTPRCVILSPTVDWDAGPKDIRARIGPSAWIYPPFTLFQSERVWGKRGALRLPDQIRPLLEAAQSIPESLPTGAAELVEELQALIEKMRSTAWMTDVFKTPSVGDEEGTQTRWDNRPTAWVVLLRSKPRQGPGHMELEFLDGHNQPIVPGPFDFELAKLLHRNAVRVPRYLLRSLLISTGQPSWLAQHFPQSVLYVVDPTTHQITPYPEETSLGYDLYYNSELGIWHERRGAPTEMVYESEEETWY